MMYDNKSRLKMVIILIKIAIMIKHAMRLPLQLFSTANLSFIAKINISEVHGFSSLRRNVVPLT